MGVGIGGGVGEQVRRQNKDAFSLCRGRLVSFSILLCTVLSLSKSLTKSFSPFMWLGLVLEC